MMAMLSGYEEVDYESEEVRNRTLGCLECQACEFWASIPLLDNFPASTALDALSTQYLVFDYS